MLVNIHIPYIILLLLVVGLNPSNAQVWTLEKCIDTAQVHNKNLQISRNTIAIGEQKHKEAKANLMPKITANADYKYFTNLPYQLMPLSVFGGADGKFKEAQFGVPHNINANLQLSMPLYNPQMYGAIQTTEIASELTDLQYQKTEEQIYFEITNLYYNAQILHHQLAFIEGNLVNARKLLQNTELLKEHLLAKGTDVSKVKLQVAQISTQKESIVSKYEQVLNALKFAMGIPVEQHLQIQPEIEYQKVKEYTRLSILDIGIIKTQNRLLTSELNTLKHSKLPSISLFGTYGSTGFGYDKRPDNFLKFYPVGFAGIQLSSPIFSGTVTKRKINQKKLELQNNELQLGLLTEQNKMQVENSKLQRFVAQKSVETTDPQIKLAQSIYEQTILQQKQGTANLTDVLLADNALREAQQTYLSAVIDYLKADLELKKATGNILSTK
ncbi:transporter [Pelobium manganitolerans]|uniref:Transporter n=1 Tax=Pelobium manganitolerans TaxID=1842495 RepID=A0A419S514_9SPHI|nr:TolC family protein [Pelobium manganitolerans]RKD15195.1 transporter [Pelobium manganitolerans]